MKGTDAVLTDKWLTERLHRIGIRCGECAACTCSGDEETCTEPVTLDALLAFCRRKGWSVAARNGIDGGWCASVGGNTIHYAEGRTLVRALALAVLDATGKKGKP